MDVVGIVEDIFGVVEDGLTTVVSVIVDRDTVDVVDRVGRNRGEEDVVGRVDVLDGVDGGERGRSAVVTTDEFGRMAVLMLGEVSWEGVTVAEGTDDNMLEKGLLGIAEELIGGMLVDGV